MDRGPWQATVHEVAKSVYAYVYTYTHGQDHRWALLSLGYGYRAGVGGPAPPAPTAAPRRGAQVQVVDWTKYCCLPLAPEVKK